MNKQSGKKMSSFIHINPHRGQIKVNSFSPIVMMKKIRLKRSDESENGLGYLPEVEDEDIPIQEELVKEDTSKLLGHELSFIHTMNQEERNAHVKKCLEMSLENKITPKNAFALQLIDCMSLLVQDKQEDFSKMACTLDAGAKIYSNRVDALHQQVVKLADEVILNEKKKKEKHDKDDSADMMTKEKRKERKKNIIVSSESLQRKLKGKDPRSRFIKFEGLPGSITNRARRDPKDLSYSLENNLPFWKNWDQNTPLRTGGRVALPNIKILREKDKEQDAIEPQQSHEKQNECMKEEAMEVQDNNNSKPSHDLIAQDLFDCDEPTADYNCDDSIEEEDIHKLNEDKETNTEEVGVVAAAMRRLSSESDVNGIKSAASCRLEALKILFKEASDYHYLDIKNVHFWAGPEFWKRSKIGVNEKKKITRNKKDPGEILYNCDRATIEDKWNSLFNKKTALTTRTITSWKKNKLTLPMDLKVEINLFFELFHLSNYDGPDESLQDKKKVVDSFDKEDAEELFTGHNISTEDADVQELSGSSTNPDPLNSSFYEGVPGQSSDHDGLNSAFYDVGMITQSKGEISHKNDLGRVIGVHMSPNLETSFDENTLVPAPKIVSFQPIKYSIRPVQVDMKHLKETLMSIINEEIDKDMQEKMMTPCSSANAKLQIIPATKFSLVLKKLPNRLEKRTAQSLSIAMAFLTLLTVTNENNLQLEDTGDSDVIIRLENEQ